MSALHHLSRRELLSTEQLKSLNTINSSKVLCDITVCWLVIIGSWALAAWGQQIWLYFICAAIVGNRFYALFIIGHDGLHRRLHNNKDKNDLISDIFVLAPIFAITRLNNRNHLNHHKYFGTSQDPDRYKYESANKAEATSYVLYLTGISTLFRSAVNVFFKPAPGEMSDRASANKAKGYTTRDVLVLIAVQTFLFATTTVFFGWWGYFLMWALPVYLFTFVPDFIRSFAEHSHPEHDSVADEHRLITFECNKIEQMIFAPMNMNYHAVHHLWPTIPYYNLLPATQLIKNNPLSDSLVWRHSYFHYLVSYLKKLPLKEYSNKQ